MMDKKIQLAQIQASKSKESKPKPTKKTAVKEARELGLQYIGEGNYANADGKITHVARDGYLVDINK